MTTAVITGIGAVSALGRGVSRVWSAMAEGWDGIAPIQRFDPTGFGVALAGMVPDRNAAEHDATPTWRLCVEFAIDAGREALAQAKLANIPPTRIALVMGSSLGDPDMPIHQMTERIGAALGASGPRLTVSTACSSSTNALGLALDLLRVDAADVVIAGGTDVLTPLVLAGFTALGVLTASKCAPFSEPAGTTLGEGAGFLVLERRDHAARRGAIAPLALLGYGLSADGFHDTGPDPTGGGVARAIRAALTHAGIAPAEVDYINAHGTGTRANDPAEWRAIQSVFGDRAAALPISSSKSFLGHAQGAAGILETIATLVALDHKTIPPTQHYSVARPNSPPDPVGQATARPAACEIALCCNSAFGGANCSVVIGRTPAKETAAAPRPVFIAGLSAVGPHGTSLDALRHSDARGRAAEFHLETIAPSIDPRGLDPCTRYLTAAAALALTNAGVKIRGEARDRSGLVVGVTVASPSSEHALTRTIDDHGYRGMSANLFSRMVLNAPGGTCAKHHGLRGAHSTVSIGDGSGLFAVAYAAELLASRDDNDRIIAVGVDELPPGDHPSEACEGAAGVLLSTTPTSVRVASWNFGGPGQLDSAARAAMSAAGIPVMDLIVGPLPTSLVATRHLTPEAIVGTSPAYTSALGVVMAAQLIRAGEVRSALVTHSRGASADCAIVLTREENCDVT